jgi:hypothetical protein
MSRRDKLLLKIMGNRVVLKIMSNRIMMKIITVEMNALARVISLFTKKKQELEPDQDHPSDSGHSA